MLCAHTGARAAQLENKVVHPDKMFPQLLQEERGEEHGAWFQLQLESTFTFLVQGM